MAKNYQKIKYIIGVDEAGRGPLAGPVAVAAIAIPYGAKLPKGVRDSKKLSAAQRERLRAELASQFPFKVVMVGANIIDRIGIGRAVHLAVSRAVRRLAAELEGYDVRVMLDGLLHAPREFQQETVIHGDDLVPTISAASIMAKTARDRKMLTLHHIYPEYRFDAHMGYGTALHRKALQKHGLSPEHRRGYCRTFLA